MLLVYDFWANGKKNDIKKLKTIRRWVPINYQGTKKWSQMVSHDSKNCFPWGLKSNM